MGTNSKEKVGLCHRGKLAFNTRVEAPITNHFRDFAPNSEKYKVVQIFAYRKIEIRKINFLNI
jgi:hypothetical protein